MKTLCIFNGKGGVGKTLHTTMMASWLKYQEGARVAVVDLECPRPRIMQTRKDELELMNDSSSWLSRYLEKHGRNESLFDVFPFGEGVNSFSSDKLKEYVENVWNFVTSKGDDYDYVLFDFGAGFIEFCPAFQLISSGLVDLVAIPFDVDATTRREAVTDARQIIANEQRVVAFWNNVSVDDVKRPGYLDRGEEIFKRFGIEVLPQRIKSFVKAKRESDERLFVKSTVCWPQRYVEMACPQVIDLYRELKGRLDRM
jgi:cellulose biosynthesis protein BcsQ